ncbi:ATPase AAA domain-containing protein 1 [Sparganum proliferum]
MRLNTNALALLGSALLSGFVGPWLYKHLLALIILAFYCRALEFPVPGPPFTLYVFSVIAFLTAFGLRSITSKKFRESLGCVSFRVCCIPLFTFLILRANNGLVNLSGLSRVPMNTFSVLMPIFIVVFIWREKYRTDFLTFVELSNLISLQSVFCYNLFQNGPSSKKTVLPYWISVLAFATTSIMLLALRTSIFVYFYRNTALTVLALFEIVLFLSFGYALAHTPTEDNGLSCTTLSLASSLVITLILGWRQLSNRLGSLPLKPSRILWLMVLSAISCLATLAALSFVHAKRKTYFSLAVGLLFACTHLTDVILYYALISPPVVSLCHSGASVLLAYILHHGLVRTTNVRLSWPIATFGLLVPALTKALFVCVDLIIATSQASPWPEQLRTARTTSNSHFAVLLLPRLLLSSSSPRQMPVATEVVGCLMLFAGLLGAFRVFLLVTSLTVRPLPSALKSSPEARIWMGLVLTFLWFYLTTRLSGIIQVVWMWKLGRPQGMPPPIFALLLTTVSLYRPNATKPPTLLTTVAIAGSCDGEDDKINHRYDPGTKVDLNGGYLVTCLHLLCLLCALPIVPYFTLHFWNFIALLLFSYVLIPACAYLTLSLPLRVATALWVSPRFSVNLTRPSIVLRVVAVSLAALLLLDSFLYLSPATSLLVVCFTGSLMGVYCGSASVSSLAPRVGVRDGEPTVHLRDVASLILCYACVAQSSILLLLALISRQMRSLVVWRIGLGSVLLISQYAYHFSSRACFTKRHQSRYFDWRIVVYVNTGVSLTFMALCFSSLSQLDQPQVCFIPLVLLGLRGKFLQGPRRIVPALVAFTLLSFISAFLQLCLFKPLFNWRSVFELLLLLALLPLYLSLLLNRLGLNLCKRPPKNRLAVGFPESADGVPLSRHLPVSTAVGTTLATTKSDHLLGELGPAVASLKERFRDVWSTVCGFFRNFFDGVNNARSTTGLNLYPVENSGSNTEERLLLALRLLIPIVTLAGSLGVAYYLIDQMNPTAKEKRAARKKAQEILRYLKVSPMPSLTDYEVCIAVSLVDTATLETDWSSIGGLDSLIADLCESVIYPFRAGPYLPRSKLFRPPKGVLFYGPPGCGKTMLARATARAAKARFFNLQISNLVNMWYGESQKLAEAVFSLAHKLQPSIIFIDEIDSFLTTRSSLDNESTRMMKTQFMALWDGLLSETDSRIMVIGATNRPRDLDAAILRRLPYKVCVPLPDAQQRLKILNVHLRQEVLDNSVTPAALKQFAERAEGLSGSDLFEICREAALCSLRSWLSASYRDEESNGSNPLPPTCPLFISMRDFDYAYKKFIQSQMDEPSQPLVLHLDRPV